jgi:hypothetical protein
MIALHKNMSSSLLFIYCHTKWDIYWVGTSMYWSAPNSVLSIDGFSGGFHVVWVTTSHCYFVVHYPACKCYLNICCLYDNYIADEYMGWTGSVIRCVSMCSSHYAWNRYMQLCTRRCGLSYRLWYIIIRKYILREIYGHDSMESEQIQH